MFSLLWSEHCSYKHSRKLLRTLPTEGEHVVMGPGENAGAVDVGGGLACAFKVESHNPPSAVEPFQGAATGVGGILRDIFAIGARPIAVLDSLRFGDPETSERSRYLLDRAVAGIGGASVLASAELGEGDEDKRPTVQVGDPFAEKKLLECSLELLDRGLIVSLQDLGAAGLSSSSSEMAAKGGVGIDLDVSRVPLREADMEPFEIMISESQERMLCVVEPERLDDVVAVCRRWEVNATAIGEVTGSGHLR